jgi:5-formyltetrahydrofolate cyclo-ligase
MNESNIARINELYHKSQAEGLTAAEKEEQAKLRARYLADIRSNLRGQLNNIDLVNPDGTVENLGEKYGNKQKHAN